MASITVSDLHVSGFLGLGISVTLYYFVDRVGREGGPNSLCTRMPDVLFFVKCVLA